MIQAILRRVANYDVNIEGQLPQEPSLLLPYPHGEHADSILLPPRKVAYVAARDTFFTNVVQRYILAAVLDTIPITRGKSKELGHNQLKREIALQKQVLEQRHKHVVVYPQGTRRGSADSHDELRTQLKDGIPFMARKLQVPVVPIGIHRPDGYDPKKGGTNAWTEFKTALRSGQRAPGREVTVRMGDPLPAEAIVDNELFMSTLAYELFALAHLPSSNEQNTTR